MGENIVFERVKTKEQFDRLKTFAESFEHKLGWHDKKDIYIFRKGDVWLGYGEVINCPFVYPSFHPDFATPRNVHDCMTMFKGLAYGSHLFGGLAYVATNPDSKFSQPILEKLGFKRMNREIYCLGE